MGEHEARKPNLADQWESIYGELAEVEPVYAAARAMWRYEVSLRETEKLGDTHIATGELQRLQYEKNKLIAALPTEHEREMARLHAQLALGPEADPDTPPDGVEIYEVDDDEPLGPM